MSLEHLYHQAEELIKTLPYFKSLVRMPFVINESKMYNARSNDVDTNTNELLCFDELDID